MIIFISILIIVLLSVICAIFGRAGGMDKSPTALPTWIPVWLRQSWVRDWLCPMCVYILFFPFNNPISMDIVWWLVAYGFTGLSLTTYWDNMFSYDNLYFSGFMVGFSAMFLIGLGVAWWILLIRAIVLAGVWGGLNWYCNKKGSKVADGTEELLRYGSLVLTLLV